MVQVLETLTRPRRRAKSPANSERINSVSRISVLDRLGFEEQPVDLNDCIELISSRDAVIATMLRGKEGTSAFPEKAQFGEFFIDVNSGMHFGMVFLPSKVSREVGASIAVLGVKPNEGVGGLIALDQNERKNKFISSLEKITGIVMIDHGYGAGEGINIPIFDALAKGTFFDVDNLRKDGIGFIEKPIQRVQLTENELVISLMTKGSGGTFLDSHERMGRDNLPEFSIESALAQYWEAKAELDILITRELLAESLSDISKARNRELLTMLKEPQNKNYAQNKIAEEALRRSELLSGTWMNNRIIANDGHSMAGWEVVRDCVAKVYGQVREEMKPFYERLSSQREELFSVINQYSPEILKESRARNTSEGILWQVAYMLKNSSLIRDFQGKDSGLHDLDSGTSLALGEIASIALGESLMGNQKSGDSMANLEQLLQNTEPNAQYHSETPLVIGPKAEKARKGNLTELDGQDAVYLTNVARSPGLRVLLAMSRMHSDFGLIGFKIGSVLKIVEKELGDFIDNNAFGVTIIRAVHLLGLSKYLGAVRMNDNALKNATQVVGQRTINKIEDKYHRVLMREDSLAAGKISVLRVWEGVKDMVLNNKVIANLGMLLQKYMKSEGNSVLGKDYKSGHYLGWFLKARIWAEIFGRNRAVVHHRKMVTMYLAEWMDKNPIELET